MICLSVARGTGHLRRRIRGGQAPGRRVSGIVRRGRSLRCPSEIGRARGRRGTLRRYGRCCLVLWPRQAGPGRDGQASVARTGGGWRATRQAERLLGLARGSDRGAGTAFGGGSDREAVAWEGMAPEGRAGRVGERGRRWRRRAIEEGRVRKQVRSGTAGTGWAASHTSPRSVPARSRYGRPSLRPPAPSPERVLRAQSSFAFFALLPRPRLHKYAAPTAPRCPPRTYGP